MENAARSKLPKRAPKTFLQSEGSSIPTSNFFVAKAEFCLDMYLKKEIYTNTHHVPSKSGKQTLDEYKNKKV